MASNSNLDVEVEVRWRDIPPNANETRLAQPRETRKESIVEDLRCPEQKQRRRFKTDIDQHLFVAVYPHLWPRWEATTMMEGAPPAPHDANAPKLKYDGNVELPVPQLKNIKNHLEQLHHRIFELQASVLANGSREATPWSVNLVVYYASLICFCRPELLTKYNLILQQTVLIFEQLNTRFVPPGLPPHLAAALASTAADEWPRPPSNSLPNILVHPTKIIPPGDSENALMYMLGLRRSPEQLEKDVKTVERFEKEREIKAGTFLDQKQNAMSGKVSIEPVGPHHIIPANMRNKAGPGPPPQEILRDMNAHRKEWDARAERALRAVQMVRDTYHWKARPDFRAQDLEEAEMKLEEEQQKSGSNPENGAHRPAVEGPEIQEIAPPGSTFVNDGVESNDEEDEVETEDQVMVDAGDSGEEDEEMVDATSGDVNVAPQDYALGATPDSDDDLFEEVA